MVLILGGIKSGKSAYALQLAEKHPKPRAFLATAEPFDPEMKARIERHKKNRGNEYELFEEPVHIQGILSRLQHRVVVVDCLTVWLANLYHHGLDVDREITKLSGALTGKEIFVSNEVGWGVVPEQALTREYVEHLAELNREMARRAEKVYLMVAGIPVEIKRGDKE
ncbi:MAG: bifunctional adenosylcobinamide kinase/adenosylcobinamide-phosphate guanylyltransferase [Candidatus Omnitrophota bacterium]